MGSYVGWVMYTTMICVICYVRIKAREAYNVHGYWMEDAFACLCMYPFVCSQLQLQARAVQPKVNINEDPNKDLYTVKGAPENEIGTDGFDSLGQMQQPAMNIVPPRYPEMKLQEMAQP